jgi:hypothetical protein
VRLTASCDLAGATEVTSEQSATRADAFPGGCITERFTAAAANSERLASETSSAIGFTTREELRQALSQRSDGRLELDP